MALTKTPVFAPRGSKADIEAGLDFQPKFDADGLIPAVVTDAGTGEVLMFAFMNAEALALTIETGIANFWSRSRAALWRRAPKAATCLMLSKCAPTVIRTSSGCASQSKAMDTLVTLVGAAAFTGSSQ